MTSDDHWSSDVGTTIMKDYYKILGIEKGANDDDIKKAYRKLAHQYHPDKASGNENKFKEINEAYQTLSSAEKRTYYDRFGSAPRAGGGGFSGNCNPFAGFDFGGGFSAGGGFEDLGSVGDIFEAFFEGFGGKKRKTYKRGADLEVVQEITLEDAYCGVKSDFEIKTYIVCEKCRGVGHTSEAGFTQCSTCDGQGEIRESRNSFFGSFSQVRACAKCFGSGQIPKKVCGTCTGAGRIISNHKVSVAVAAGIADGQIIKLANAGEAGERGGGVGDLYVRIKVNPHAIFKREAHDLIAKANLNLIDILLAKPVAITTISGKKIEVVIPEDFNLKSKLKISGEGMPRLGSFGKGDLYIDLEVKTPKHLNYAAQRLLEQLRKEI